MAYTNIRGKVQEQVATIEKTLKPLGYKQITALAAAKGLGDGSAIPAEANYALLLCTAQNLRWRDDGTNPTGTAGMLMRTSDQAFMYKGDLSAIKFIEVAIGAILDVTFYGDVPA